MKHILITIIMFFMTTTLGFAEEATAWSEGYGYKARLVEGHRADDGSVHVGLDIVLDDGWKTYWRVPGAHGIPPDLQFSQSTNLDEIEIEWPAPSVFNDGSGLGVGYKKRLILPIKVTPFFPHEPTTIDLSAFFGVCNEVCVPAQERFVLELNPQSLNLAQAHLVEASRAKVPDQKSIPSSPILNARYELVGDQDYVIVALKKTKDTNVLTEQDKSFLLIEGPKAWYFKPTKVANEFDESGEALVKVKLFRPTTAPMTKPVELRLTLTDPNSPTETTMILGPGA